MSNKIKILELAEMLKSGKWIYAGDDEDKSRYFKQTTGLRDLPKREGQCYCGHEIESNSYIMNIDTKEIKIIGSKCIVKFVLEEQRQLRCGNCKKRTKKNKNDDYYFCGECRRNNNISVKCDKCDEMHNFTINNAIQDYCDECYINNTKFNCDDFKDKYVKDIIIEATNIDIIEKYLNYIEKVDDNDYLINNLEDELLEKYATCYKKCANCNKEHRNIHDKYIVKYCNICEEILKPFESGKYKDLTVDIIIEKCKKD